MSRKSDMTRDSIWVMIACLVIILLLLWLGSMG